MLFRMLEWERCPRITAGIPARIPSGKIAKMPRIRLPTAFPSVCGCPRYGCGCGTFGCWNAGAAVGVPIGDGRAAVTAAPHWGQAEDASGIAAPHLKQNMNV